MKIPKGVVTLLVLMLLMWILRVEVKLGGLLEFNRATVEFSHSQVELAKTTDELHCVIVEEVLKQKADRPGNWEDETFRRGFVKLNEALTLVCEGTEGEDLEEAARLLDELEKK